MTNTKKIAKLRQSPPRTVAEIIERVQLLGCEVERGRHYRVLRDGVLVAVVAMTPSCSRGVMNGVTSLRRAGVDVRAMKLV
jgi:hypothetical protein